MLAALNDMGARFERTSEAHNVGVAVGKSLMFRQIKAMIEKMAWDFELGGKHDELDIMKKVISAIDTIKPPSPNI